MRFVAICSVLLVLAWSSGWAIDLGKQPVQEAMQAELNSPVLVSSDFYAADEFGGANEDDTDFSETTSERPGRKSLQQALLYSFLLPGMGEYYAGSTKKARYFWAAEALLWGGFIGFRLASDAKEDDYVRYAQLNAGIDLKDESEFTRKMVGFYQDTEEYNAAGRVSDRDRPYYDPNGALSWQWSSPGAQDAYRELRNDSDELERRSNFMILGMILNRVVSMVDAALDVRRVNNSFDQPEGGSWGYDITSDPFLGYDNVHVSIFARF